jgi:hypothetical protein
MLSLSQKRRRLLTIERSKSFSSSHEVNEQSRRIFRPSSHETKVKMKSQKRSNRFGRLLATFNSFDTEDSLEVNRHDHFDEEYFVSFPRALVAANSHDEEDDVNFVNVCYAGLEAEMDESIISPEIYIGKGGKILFEI